MLILAVAPVFCAAVPGFGPGAAYAAVVSSISVQGNTRVDATTIRSHLTIEPGRSFGPGDIDESVKALYETGLFSDVTIVQRGGTLVVSVVENRIVNEVLIQGNKKIKSPVLMQLIETKPRGVLTDAKLEGDVERIKAYYDSQGRSLASVEPQVTDLPNNRVDVAFVIREGARTGIGSIKFVGNNAFSDTRLRSVIQSRQRNILSWLTKKDVFDENKLQADQEALRRFYMSHGYADFRVISVDDEFDEEKGRYYVTFTVEEGDRYKFSSIEVDSTIPGTDPAQLRRYVKTKPGRVFNATLVERSMEDLTIELASQGYAFAQVRPRGDRNYENHTIAVTYLIDEGPRVYIERIDIHGNTKTRDYVIRREFDVSEGDAYNRVLIDRAERKLRALGFFKTVSISTEPGSTPDRVIVNVYVEDQSTGEFAVGAGYGTQGFIAEISMEEKNFLGRGQYLKIAVGAGEDEQTYNLSFTDPYFLGTRMSFGFDLYYNVYDKWPHRRPFDEEVAGGTLRFGLPITEELTAHLNYKLFQQSISNSTRNTRDYFPNGDFLTSAIGYGLTYSTIDNKLDPHEGLWLRVNQEVAGLGGDYHYIKTVGDARWYQPIIPDTDIIGVLKVQGGNIFGLGEDVAPLNNFYKGGETVRGFEPLGYGPRDKDTKVPIGGKNFWAASAEVQFPLPVLPPDFGIRGAVFADAGTLIDVDVPKGAGPIINDPVIRSSVGGSILWASPFGLLRGDFAYVLSKAPQDKLQWFRFSAGAKF